MYFLGVESAESSTRALVVDLESSKIVASAYQGHILVGGVPIGHQEQDPRMWVSALDHTVKECLFSLGEARHEVVAMSIAAQSHGLVLLDENNQVLRPAKISGDESARKQLDHLNRNFGGAPGLSEILGNRMDLNAIAPKLLWVKEREPANFQKTASVMQPREFISFWLTGVRKAEAGEASVSGLFDVVNRQWSEEILAFIDPRLKEMLSPLAAANESHLGNLRPEIAKSWGLNREIRVSLGSGLTMMRALSVGNASPGMAVLDFGVTGAVWGLGEKPCVDPRSEASLWRDATGNWLSHFNEERAVSSLEMVRAHYDWSGLEMEQAASQASLGAGGLMVLPLGHGSHTGKGEGMFHGITTMNFTPGNVARATLEGIATGLSFGFHRMLELGLSFDEIRVAGRGAGSRFWRQLIADVTGVPSCAVKNDEGVALGAAIHAAVNFLRESGQEMGFAGMAEYAVPIDQESRCEPDEDRHEFYMEQLSRQQYLAETLIGAGFLV
ncbi:MAG: FGGY family carbohydrate kinase [Akkermansiaceae bacterium]